MLAIGPACSTSANWSSRRSSTRARCSRSTFSSAPLSLAIFSVAATGLGLRGLGGGAQAHLLGGEGADVVEGPGALLGQVRHVAEGSPTASGSAAIASSMRATSDS